MSYSEKGDDKMEKVKVLRRHMAQDAIVINKAGLEEVLHQAVDAHINDLKKVAKELDNTELDHYTELHEVMSVSLFSVKIMNILFPEEEE